MAIAFYLPNGLPIYAFSLLIGIGAAGGLAWSALSTPARRGVSRQVRVRAGLWALLGALVGSRLVYVALNLDAFAAQPLEIVQLYQGGLSWPGALAGGILGMAMYADFSGNPLGQVADALLPLGALLAICAWLGCWLDGCAYGMPVQAWWAVPARDEWGELTRRVPTQIAGALLVLGLSWLMSLYASSEPARTWHGIGGKTASLGLVGLALVLLAVSLLRADPSPLWRGVRLESWAALGFAALGGLTWLALTLRPAYERSRLGIKSVE